MATPVSTQQAQTIRSAQTLLHYTQGLIPIIAGLDKFLNILTNRENYISPFILKNVAGNRSCLYDDCQIIAGLLVLIKPSSGALLVTAWLVLIAINLLLTGKYFDVAVRDLAMATGAFTIWRLTLVTASFIP